VVALFPGRVLGRRALGCAAVMLALSLPAIAQDVSRSLAEADAAMKSGRFAEAARRYEALLETRPRSKEILFALGACYVQLGRNDEAVVALRKHVGLAADSASGHAALGIALLDGTRTAEAKAELETALRLDPSQADAAEALARVHVVEGHPDKAVSLLQPLVASARGRDARSLLGEALIRAGQPEAAAELFEPELAVNPQSPVQSYVTAALARLKAGHLARAAEICELGMRVHPDSEIESVYLSLPAAVLAQRIAARVERLRAAPDAAEMIAVGRVLTDADPARKTRANEIARWLLADAITLRPKSASAHYNYGRALRQTSLEQALAQWQTALDLDPSAELQLQIQTHIAKARLDLADMDGAEQAFRAALEVNESLPKRRPEAALEYVRFLQLRGRSAEAETLLRRVLAWNPLSPHAHLEEAKLLASANKWNEVVEEGQFILANGGEDKDLVRAAHFLLARAYHRLNQPEKARRHTSLMDAQ
jgi:tetratricopeptide (TPR) repeat protein